MHILLVEPKRARRQNLALLLTTTGGFKVTSIATLSTAKEQNSADLLMISQRLFQPQQIAIPCILFDANQYPDVIPPVIGYISQQTTDIAIAEKVRMLWEQHSAL
ncbi:hypothetical protein [Neptunicella sp. SCSIO 80796]|uniref:hypothetical protein n=1 Tax=Neptunicella plasticusilytica TaxID=3117012 RepID=UPI003A4DA710